MALKAFVDLDRVLYNSDALKIRHLAVLGALLDGKRYAPEILALYNKSKRDSIYDVDRHIALLSQASGYPAFDIRKKIESFMRRDAQQFMYPDAELFLQRLAELGYEIWIATAGIDWFQEEKIPVDFYRCIAGVKVTQDTTKTSVIGRFADPEKDDIVLFDDSVEVINPVKQIFPNVCAIQVAREDVPYPAKDTIFADSRVRNLEEAFGAIIHRPR